MEGNLTSLLPRLGGAHPAGQQGDRAGLAEEEVVGRWRSVVIGTVLKNRCKD